MDSKIITDMIDRQEWIKPVAETLQNGVAGTYKAIGPAAPKIQDALHGVWLGHALHPVLTDVPIGAWTAAAAFDLSEAIGGRDDLAAGADAAVGLGLLAALGAAIAGLTDWYLLQNKSQQRTGAVHALLNIGATALYTTSWVLRRRGHRASGRAFGWMGYAVVGASAYLGGSLVYEQRVGVDHAPRQGLPSEFVAVMAESDLPEGQPKKAEADGVPVVLVRQGGQISALTAACSHLGGPLEEGKVEDGGIVCPWHGSRFCLKDGEVLNGPATFPQPYFETRVREGRIEVRAPAVPQNQD